MNLLVRMKFGSHLYGTDTKKSDTDYKGIYLPTLREVVLHKDKKSIHLDSNKVAGEKNTRDDIDYEIHSIQHFLKLAYKGEAVTLDMLHCPKGWEETSSPEWEFLKQNRKKFYTKGLKAYLGYCRTQASKYGIKGSRLADAEKVLNFLKQNDPTIKLKDIWELLPTGEHIKIIEVENCSQDDARAIEICSRKLMTDTKVTYAIDCIQKFYDNYGARSKLAKENKGLDWKAISHALRAGYQLKEIYETGNLKYPLEKAQFLREIKAGKYHYKDDKIAERLEDLIDEVEILAQQSGYPDEVDVKFFEDWLVSLYTRI